jgi:hypothetical protein
MTYLRLIVFRELDTAHYESGYLSHPGRRKRSRKISHAIRRGWTTRIPPTWCRR